MNKSYAFTTKREAIEVARKEARVSATNEDYIAQLHDEINEKDAYIAKLEEAILEEHEGNAILA